MLNEYSIPFPSQIFITKHKENQYFEFKKNQP